MKRKIDKTHAAGFSLVELLTTLAVIGILLGLLIPALNQVSKTATGVRQKAQFHAIGTALEAFRNDYGDYPPSMRVQAYGNYSPSQRLAEAIVGRDGLGFHKSSLFGDDGLGDADRNGVLDVIYGDPSSYTAETLEENLAARNGPYLELESANAVTLQNLYGAGNYGPRLANTFLLADMYKITQNKATGKMTGSPILYYKANRLKVGHDASSPDKSTYNVKDSTDIVALNPLVGGSHPLSGDFSLFYNKTLNPNLTSPPRPYRSESFILHSAGPDGLYGTTDDMFNFETE